MRIIGTKILLSTPKTAQLTFSKLREALYILGGDLDALVAIKLSTILT